jgi:hypothetical protein
MRVITVEILGVDVYIGFVALAIGMLVMATLVLATCLDSKKEGN